MVRLRVAAVIVAVLTANTAVQAQDEVGDRTEGTSIRKWLRRPAPGTPCRSSRRPALRAAIQTRSRNKKRADPLMRCE